MAPASDFFLVYAPEDLELVTQVARELGISLANRSLTAQARMRATVVWLSPRSAAAEHFVTQVAHALALKRNHGHVVIPVFLDHHEPREAALEPLSELPAIQFVRYADEARMRRESPGVPQGELEPITPGDEAAAIVQSLREILAEHPPPRVVAPHDGVVSGEVDNEPTERSDSIAGLDPRVVQAASAETTRYANPIQGPTLVFQNVRAPSGANLGGQELTAQSPDLMIPSIPTIRPADLSGQDLRGRDLRGGNMSGYDLSRCCLAGMNLQGTSFAGAILHHADLRAARLIGADLRYAHLEGADLTDANLSFAQLDRAYVNDMKVDGAYFVGASCINTVPSTWRPPPERSLGCAFPNDRPVHVVAAPATIARCLAWSPGGSTAGGFLATGHEDGTVRLWDARGREICVVAKHRSTVRSLAWSPDGKHLAVGVAEGTTIVSSTAFEHDPQPLSAATGEPLAHVTSVAWSADGTHVAVANDRSVVVQDVRTGRQRPGWTGDHNVRCLAWHPSRGVLAFGTAEGRLGLWRRATGERIAADNQAPVMHIGWSADGERLATAGGDGKIRLWSGDRLAPDALVFSGHPDGARSVSWDHEGKRIASAGGDMKVRVWSLDDRSEIAVLGDAGVPLWAVAWHPTGDTVAAVSDADRAHVWSTFDWSLTQRLDGNRHKVTMDWSEARGELAVGVRDRHVRIWPTQRSGPAEERRAPHGIQAVAFSPDGSTLAMATSRPSIVLRTATEDIELSGCHSVPTSLAWQHDGQAIVARCGRTVQRWRSPWGAPEDFGERAHGAICIACGPGDKVAFGGVDGIVRIAPGDIELRDHNTKVRAVAWRHDGALASASEDGALRIWDLRLTLAERVQDFDRPVTSLAWARDGRLALGCADGSLWLREGEVKPVRHAVHATRLTTVAWIEGDTRVAAAADDGTVHLWDAETRACVAVLHASDRAWATFHPQGRYRESDPHGAIGATFWHLRALFRSEVGALDLDHPDLRAPTGSSIRALAPTKRSPSQGR